MKKAFRLLGLSALVLGLAVACNNQPTEEVTEDTAAVVEEEAIEEVTIDSAMVTDEPEQPVVDKKKTTTTKKNNNTGVTVKAGDAEATVTVNAEEPVKAVEVKTTATDKDADLSKKATKAKKAMR